MGLFNEAIRRLYYDFATNHLIDTYVFCLSRHHESNSDGTLSMWRTYGGRGTGGALVFDPNVLADDVDSPFVVAPVTYKSPAEQQEWVENLARRVASIFENASVNEADINHSAWIFFSRVLTYVLFTKHGGFHEECEWRVVYFKFRDSQDAYKSMRSYRNGPRGIEPILKFKSTDLKNNDGASIALDDLIKFIIIGPTNAYRLVRQSFCRMLEVIEKPHLIDRVSVSQIPLRPS